MLNDNFHISIRRRSQQAACSSKFQECEIMHNISLQPRLPFLDSKENKYIILSTTVSNFSYTSQWIAYTCNIYNTLSWL